MPLHPLLLAAFAVLSVYAGNLAEVLPVDLGGPTGPLVRALVGAAAALGVRAAVPGLASGCRRGQRPRRRVRALRPHLVRARPTAARHGAAGRLGRARRCRRSCSPSARTARCRP
ncbi:MAG: hypothetical protein R3C32_11285 [Chloroflexota bacterium]